MNLQLNQAQHSQEGQTRAVCKWLRPASSAFLPAGNRSDVLRLEQPSFLPNHPHMFCLANLGSYGQVLSRALIQRGSEICAWAGGGVWSTGAAGAAGLPASLRAGPGLAYVSSRTGATLVVQRAAIKLALLSVPVGMVCVNSISLHSLTRQRSGNSFSPGLLISFKPRYSACLTGERKKKKGNSN